jgi:hypothetical protein
MCHCHLATHSSSSSDLVIIKNWPGYPGKCNNDIQEFQLIEVITCLAALIVLIPEKVSVTWLNTGLRAEIK